MNSKKHSHLESCHQPPRSATRPLPNAQHEVFAQQAASGKNATEAYLSVYGTENRRAAATGGSRLMRRKPIAARIEAIQQAGADGVALNLRDIHRFINRVVRTPAGEVTPSSDLCTRTRHTRHGAIDVWMPDKLACVRLSARLQGFLSTARCKPAQSDPSPSAPDDTPPILTEKRRAPIIESKRATQEARQKQDEEARLAQQERRAEERRIFEEELRQNWPHLFPQPSAQNQPPGQPKPLSSAAHPSGAGHHPPSASRVTSDSFSKTLNNYHYPAPPYPTPPATRVVIPRTSHGAVI